MYSQIKEVGHVYIKPDTAEMAARRLQMERDAMIDFVEFGSDNRVMLRPNMILRGSHSHHSMNVLYTPVIGFEFAIHPAHKPVNHWYSSRDSPTGCRLPSVTLHAAGKQTTVENVQLMWFTDGEYATCTIAGTNYELLFRTSPIGDGKLVRFMLIHLEYML